VKVKQQESMTFREGGLTGQRVVIQGLGNAGYHTAKYLSEEDRVSAKSCIPARHRNPPYPRVRRLSG